MAFTGFPKDTVPYLRELGKNNDKKWFEANRARLEVDWLDLRMPAAFLCVFILAASSVASADAIAPRTLACPPGLNEIVTHAGPACAPRPCSVSSPGTCGRGATCRERGECLAIREIRGRLGSSRTEVPIGPCDRRGQCDEGRCRHIEQCEPNAVTPGWDRRHHRWTGGGRRASFLVAGGAILGLARWLRKKLRGGDPSTSSSSRGSATWE